MVFPVKFLGMIIFAMFVLGGIVAAVIVSIVVAKKSNQKNAGAQYGAQNPANYTPHPNVGNNSNYNQQGVNYGYNEQIQQQMHNEFNRQMQQQMNDEFNRQAMEEGFKSVTPFDQGGYVQGPGFNPSDTATQQMNDMNNMNMGMF